MVLGLKWAACAFVLHFVRNTSSRFCPGHVFIVTMALVMRLDLNLPVYHRSFQWRQADLLSFLAVDR